MMFGENRSPGPSDFDLMLWVEWILATTLGWATGWVLNEFAVGITIGLAQWIVLRRRIGRSAWWIAASALGWATGRGLAVAVLPSSNTILIGGVVGATLGLAQWLLLRRWVVRSWWWIVVSALSWSVALTGLLGPTLVGSIAGATTGLALEPLLRYSKARSSEEEPT